MFSWKKWFSGPLREVSSRDEAIGVLVSDGWLSPAELIGEDLDGHFILVKEVAGVNSHNQLRPDVLRSHAIGFIEVCIVADSLRPAIEALLAHPESLPLHGVPTHARIHNSAEPGASGRSRSRHTQIVSNHLSFSIAADIESVQKLDCAVSARAALEQEGFDKQFSSRTVRKNVARA